VTGGEQVSASLLEEFRALRMSQQLRLFNAYGLSEVSIVSNIFEIPYEKPSLERILVGYTGHNHFIYVVNEEFQLVPIGHHGEILVGGAGIAK
jgi:non-ribosomal peptide synthetase component F